MKKCTQIGAIKNSTYKQRNGLYQWFLNHGPQTNNISFTWLRLRNAHSQPPPSPRDPIGQKLQGEASIRGLPASN